MSVKQSQVFSSKQEMLDALTESLLLPKDYAKVGSSYVGNEPLKSSRKDIPFDDLNYVNNDRVVIRLNLPEQLYVHRSVSKRFGIKTRHGSLRENLEAAYSKETADYKKNVLIPYWVFTGEVIRRFGSKHDVSRAIDADFVTVQSADILLKRDGKSLETKGGSTKLVPEITLRPTQQTTVPTKSGYYSKFSGIIPTDSELGERNKESKGYFGGIYFDKQDLSAVGCYWGSVGRVLYAYADGPLDWVVFGVLGVWTDENPKK